jgi:probable phosphoglycerate mutase
LNISKAFASNKEIKMFTSCLQRPAQRLLLIRHGQAGDKRIKRYIGQIDIELTKTGLSQAKALAQSLESVPLERIISSDLKRCKQTAAILAEHRSLKIEEEPNLREISLGQWEGRSFADIKQNQPEAFRLRGDNLAGFRPPEGESFSDLQSRVVPVFNEVLAISSGNVAIVAHAGVIRVALCHFLGLSLDNLFKLGQDYGSLTILEVRPNQEIRLKALNLIP